jgi:hypothetical protein
MPEFRIFGSYNEDKERACLWDCVKKVNNGQNISVFYQKTGSCVGNAIGQCVWYLMAAEIVRTGDMEEFTLPFYLISYGRSRYHSGIRGRGDGSTGSGAAKAIRQDGIIPANLDNLPRWQDQGGITYGAKTEMDWSDGARISEEWLTQSRKHPVKTTALLKNVDDLRACLQNYYPAHTCSNWGGLMQCPTKGTPSVVLNHKASRWAHAQSFIGYWKHPELGELYYVLNSWGYDAHYRGEYPNGEPRGGYWVQRKDAEIMVGAGETFAYSQFDGFLSNPLDEKLFDIIGK